MRLRGRVVMVHRGGLGVDVEGPEILQTWSHTNSPSVGSTRRSPRCCRSVRTSGWFLLEKSGGMRASWRIGTNRPCAGGWRAAAG